MTRCRTPQRNGADVGRPTHLFWGVAVRASIGQNAAMRRTGTALAIGAMLIMGMTQGAQATFSGPPGSENGRIFYTVGSFPNISVLSACPATGGHIKNVVNNATYPMPSPDGEKVAYMKLTMAGNDGLWIANADGSDPVRIVPPLGVSSPVSWSPDGTKLTFRKYVVYPAPAYSQFQPVVVDIATKVVTPLLPDGTMGGDTEQSTPNAWSADGSTIFFPGHPTTESDDDLYKVSAGGGSATRVTGDSNALPYFQRIDVAPDNSTMLVAQQVSYYDGATFDPLSETRILPVNGGNTSPLIGSMRVSSGVGDEAFAYSPDGERVVFMRSPGSQLMTAEKNGADPVPLGSVSGIVPQWSVNVDDCTDPGAATMRINEVKLGDDRFVELLDPADETFPTPQAPYKLVVFDGAGAKVGAQPIPEALLQGRDNTQPLLLSDTGGDVPLSVTLPSPGQACFTKGAGEQKVSCVSWGCVATTVSGGSTRIPAPGPGQSSQRQGVGSTVFHLAAPTPKATNIAGATADPCEPAPPGADPGAGGSGGSGGAGGATTPPKPKLTIKGGSVLTLKGGAVAFTFACGAGAACSGKATLTAPQGGNQRAARTLTIGTAKIKIAAGTSAKIKIKLNKSGKKLLRKKGKKVNARLTVTLTGGGALGKSLTLRR